MGRKPPRKQSTFSFVVSLISGAIVGYAGMAAGARYLPQWFRLSPFELSDTLWLLVSLPLVFFLVVTVHELGHLAGAKLSGFRFRVLTLGPWSIIATDDRWHHRFTFSAMGIISGQQISSPPPEGAGDRQFVVYLLGGGVANLIAAGLAYWCATALQLPPLAVAMLLAFVLLSIFLGVINLLPISTAAGVRTDGYQIRTLLRGDDDAVRFRALFAVIADVYAGVRPREWSRTQIGQLRLGKVNSLEQMLALLVRMQASLDHDDIDDAAAAAAEIEPLYDELPEVLRSQFAAELAYFHGAVRIDAAKARRYANDIAANAYLISPATVHRGKAAVLFAEGKYADAAQEIAQGLACVDRGTTELDRVMEPLWLRQLQERIDLRMAAMPEVAKSS